LPGYFSRTLEAYRGAAEGSAAKLAHQRELDGILERYRSALELSVTRCNALLPRLRRASQAWYRLDLRFRKPLLLDMDQLAAEVDTAFKKQKGSQT
jgi:hypothetical protein